MQPLFRKQRRETIPKPVLLRSVYDPMTNPNPLIIGTEVMAPVWDALHRGVIAEAPPGQPLKKGAVFVRLTPPIAAAQPFISIEFVICPADWLTIGWL